MADDDTIDVFISSTCYDLIDLRSVLHSHLKAQGFIVRFSDAFDSDFEVPGTEDSIATCLTNVAASRAVVCVMDRRYGPRLPERYGGVSATHAEVRRAKELGKPLFTFVRDRAWNEYSDKLKTDPTAQTKWVESASIQNRRSWAEFMDELSKLPGHTPGSNWCDVFRDAMQLAPVVVHRLVHRFPQYAGTLAMRPDRMVRMIYLHATDSNGMVLGRFRNLGLGSALSIRHGVCSGVPAFPSQVELSTKSIGGVLEGEATAQMNGNPTAYELRSWPGQSLKLFCEYLNRFGDRYRIEVPITQRNNTCFVEQGEELYVRHGEEWHRRID